MRKFWKRKKTTNRDDYAVVINGVEWFWSSNETSPGRASRKARMLVQGGGARFSRVIFEDGLYKVYRSDGELVDNGL